MTDHDPRDGWTPQDQEQKQPPVFPDPRDYWTPQDQELHKWYCTFPAYTTNGLCNCMKQPYMTLTKESQHLLANAFGSPRCIPEYLVRTALPLIEAEARTPLLAEIEQLKAKIDRLEDRINRLEAEIDLLDDEIEELNDEIEDFDESLPCDEPGCYGEVTCGWPTRPGGTGPNGGYRQTCIKHYIARSDRKGYWT